jgi:xylulose-5-phosphate/fructose-6-phosphate phosphoketolase
LKCFQNGVGIWKFASDDDPDIVIAGAGDYVTKESLAGLELIKRELPEVNCRFVNIMTLSSTGFGCGGCTVGRKDFDNYFTADKPVIINYHGYPQTLKQILFDYCADPSRFEINGYVENGSTTTPFDMQVRNGTSRYHVVMDACEKLVSTNKISREKADEVINKYKNKLQEHTEYIKENGVDMDEIENWQWGK